ncbi:MAG: hypothetical protein V1887_03035 [Candidatus Aenigmatarchaeota archaeon]
MLMYGSMEPEECRQMQPGGIIVTTRRAWYEISEVKTVGKVGQETLLVITTDGRAFKPNEIAMYKPKEK